MNTKNLHPEGRLMLAKQGGAATILVAIILLFAMTMSAFFTHKTLVADREDAANVYRLARAQMGADSGLQLAIAAMQDNQSRAEILQRNADGEVTGFIANSFTSASSAPGENETSLWYTPAVGNLPGNTTFSVRMADLGESGEEFSKILIDVRGCWDEPGANNSDCSSCSAACPVTARASQVVAFQGSLAGMPSAALTAKGNVDLGGNAITITNTDPATNGITVHAGGEITPHSDNNLQTLPGTPPEASLAANDNELSDIPTDDFFIRFFGMDKATFKAGAGEVIGCSGVCNDRVDGKTGTVLWADPGADSFVINSNTVVGSPDNPVILIVDGPLELRGTSTIYGVVYSTSLLWDNTGGGTSRIFGSAIAEGDFEATGTPSPTYDSDIMRKLATQIGTFIPVSGSWCDHCDWSPLFP